MKWPEITKETPIEEVKQIHQMIWDYVIEHVEKPETPYLSDCAACEYAYLFGDVCARCPINWPGKPVCGYDESLYARWYRSNFKTTRKYLANKIKNIPWKFESETKS